MRYILFLLLLPLFSLSQERATTESGKTVLLKKDGTWKYVTDPKPSIIKKDGPDGSYYLSATVPIENGKGEKIDVLFEGTMPKGLWVEFAKHSASDYDYLSFIATMLTIKAKYSLNNDMSFEPLKRQFFMYNDNNFICNYKMMGRNGYGNMVETSELVRYNPEAISR